MRVLVACEESQRTCLAFRAKGHEAYSCDIIDCSGGHPEFHIKGDCLPLLNGNCTFTTADGQNHTIAGKWDLIIGHPPCTYLCNTGMPWTDETKYGEKARERKKKREEAAEFFLRFANADCEKIAIENPVGYMSTTYRKPDQIIQPWQFGDNAEKLTCLWLKGLPKLTPTVTRKPPLEYKEWIDKRTGRKRRMPLWYYNAWGSKDRSRLRSKTFQGIANAFAEQWGQ